MMTRFFCHITVMLAAFVLLPGGGTQRCLAQTLTQRQGFVDNLNAALQNIRSGQDTVLVDIKHSSVGDILLPGLDGCDTLTDADSLELIDMGDDRVMLRFLLRDVDTMHIPKHSHQLVCDLNEIWLRRPWYIKLVDSVGSDKLASACTGVANKNYYMGYLSTSDPGVSDSLSRRYDLGVDYLSGATYGIVNSSGGIVSATGSTMYTFNTGGWTFVGRYAAVGGSHIDSGRIAHYHIHFTNPYHIGFDNPYPDRGDSTVLTDVDIKFQARQYTSDCSQPGIPVGEPHPVTGGAKFTLTYTTNDGTGPHNDSCSRTFSIGSPDQDNDALWDFYQPWNDFNIRSLCQFDIDSMGYMTFKVNDGALCTDTNVYRIMRLRNPITPAEYCATTYGPTTTGEFKLDSMTGEIIFSPCASCAAELVPCLEFCSKLSGYQTITGVIAASAQSFDDRWDFNRSEYLKLSRGLTWPNQNESNNDFEVGTRGKWRANATFVYRTSIKKGAGTAAAATERVYKDAGVFVNSAGSIANAFIVYNWHNQAANDPVHWLMGDTVTKFSPHGEPVEERDIIGLYSAAKFVHANTVPRLVAKNARYGTVDFESFEEARANQYGIAHSGKYSYRLPVSHGWDTLSMSLVVDDHLIAKNLQVRFWAKRTYRDVTGGELPVALDDASLSTMTPIAQTGEWTLYERIVDLSTRSVGDTLTLHFKNALTDPSGGVPDTVWIDDIRLQPLDAAMMCYVYDRNTLRLLAQFDDQHFGLYYQYNGEGKLVRKMVETERGMKTVTESQYHTPEVLYRDGLAAPLAAGRGSAWTPSATKALGDGDAGRGDGVGGKVDLLDFEMSPDGHKLKVLGSDKPKLPSVDDLSLPSIDSMGVDPSRMVEGAKSRVGSLGREKLLKMLGPEKLRVLDSLRALDREIDAMRAKDATLSPEERKRIEERIDGRMRERKAMIEQRLGITEEQLKELYGALDASDGEGKEVAK